jgi:hypothetical protein
MVTAGAKIANEPNKATNSTIIFFIKYLSFL